MNSVKDKIFQVSQELLGFVWNKMNQKLAEMKFQNFRNYFGFFLKKSFTIALKPVIQSHQLMSALNSYLTHFS